MKFTATEDEIERFWSKVLVGDGCWEWTDCKNEHGYGLYGHQGKRWRAHRFAWQLTSQPDLLPPEIKVDHRCHNHGCVRPGHLREATNKQNSENWKGGRKGSKSGLRGVVWNARANLWWASVCHNGKRHSLGYYKDKHEAGEVARAKRNELYTHNDQDRNTNSRSAA